MAQVEVVREQLNFTKMYLDEAVMFLQRQMPLLFSNQLVSSSLMSSPAV